MLIALFHNVTLLASLASWFLSQSIKLATVMIRERRFDFGFVSRLGGMPSSHTATAAACATSVGIRTGFDSPVFTLCLGVLALVMIDAQSVRRAAGQQARLLNQMAEDLYLRSGTMPEKLTQSLGHSRAEVFVGAALGIIVACLAHSAFSIRSS